MRPAAVPSSLCAIMLLLLVRSVQSSPVPFPAAWQPPRRVARLVAPVPFFFPWITVVVIAKRLPEARFILIDQSETPDPFGTLPEVEMGNKQPRRSTVLRCERLSFVGVNDPGLATYYLFKRQIGRVATVTESDHVSSVVHDLLYQR